jgi:ABC-2 type transport system permease protein
MGAKLFKQIHTIYKREMREFINTPIAYFYIALFVGFSVFFAFDLGQFIEFNEASLYNFLQFHPYIYLFLIPALTMRIWAKEKENRTFELLASLPISIEAIIWGKFFASLNIIFLALCACIPFWIAVNFLGPIDNLLALFGLLASGIFGGILLMVCMAISANTKNQAIAYLLSFLICLILLLMGTPIISGFFGFGLQNIIAPISLIDGFDNLIRGNWTNQTMVFFAFLFTISYFLCLLQIKLQRGIK